MCLGAGTQRSETNEEYVYWGCTATILGDLAKPVRTSTCFKLRSGTQFIKLEHNPRPESLGKTKWTLVKNLQETVTFPLLFYARLRFMLDTVIN